jgi:hypothetical protein
MSEFSNYEYRKKSGRSSQSILGTKFTQEKSSPTKMGLELDPREHCLSRPTRVADLAAAPGWVP